MQQVKNYRKIGFTAILSSGLAATIVGLFTSSAFAQQTTTSPITVQSTGTISGTLVLPKFNPNYNRVLTRVDTDEGGAFYRNEGTKANPNLVKVYESDNVRMRVRDDGSINYYVNFKGIPVTSFDAVINSPVLSDGEMTEFRYDGRPDMEGARIKAVVQDEFGVKRAFYTGTLTDPETGIKYQGTFQLDGQGPRYSDPNGGDSPTVFDYKSDLPGPPRSEPFKIQDNSPLVKLRIRVPEGTSIINPSTGGGTTPPPSTGGGTTPPPPSTGGGTPPSTGGSAPTPSIPSTNLSPSSSPITSSPSTSNPSSPSGFNPSSPSGFTPSSPSSFTPSSPSNFTPSSPSPDVSNIEFSSGNSFVSNSVVENSAKFGRTTCSQDSICDSQLSRPKKRGPRSRVMMH
ncbi:MAG: hypothetical protein SWZ49_30920 [Cyanobacteriota bacterium]|nr:hypothetical protein [Cyanobacteriota bacterium]